MKGFTYVLAALGLLSAVLGLVSYGLYQKAKAAEARLETERERTAQLTDALRTSEAQTQNLLAQNKALDHAVQARVAREKALQVSKAATEKELAALKQKQSHEDQSCLNRELPADYRLRLDS